MSCQPCGLAVASIRTLGRTKLIWSNASGISSMLTTTLDPALQLAISPDARYAFSYGVYSSSASQKLIVTDIKSAHKQVGSLQLLS